MAGTALLTAIQSLTAGSMNRGSSRQLVVAVGLVGGLNARTRRQASVSAFTADRGRLRRPPASNASFAASAAKASSRSVRYSWVRP